VSAGYNTDSEDIHFYVDNAPPDEVSHVLRVLSSENPLTPSEIAKIMISEYGFEMQRDHSYSPRRLHDLRLASQERQGPKVTYKLTGYGTKLQAIQAMNPTLAIDLLHYLHYTSYSSNPDYLVDSASNSNSKPGKSGTQQHERGIQLLELDCESRSSF